MSNAAFRELDEAVLSVRGQDARSWLGGQVTNDLRGMLPGDSRYTLVLDARGKIVADAWAIERGSDVALTVSRAVVDELRAHFESYIIMEDVELAITDERVVSVQGPQAARLVAAAGLSGVACDRLGIGGSDVLTADPGAARKALAAAGVVEIDEDAYELARLRLGRPLFSRDFGRAHYPQEAGLKELAVSFEKGCYLGQEVVCTLENRGQLSRRLVQLKGPSVPAAAELSADGAVVGTITSSVFDPEQNEALALGYVKRAAAVIGHELGAGAGSLRVIAIVGEQKPGH